LTFGDDQSDRDRVGGANLYAKSRQDPTTKKETTKSKNRVNQNQRHSLLDRLDTSTLTRIFEHIS